MLVRIQLIAYHKQNTKLIGFTHRGGGIQLRFV